MSFTDDFLSELDKKKKKKKTGSSSTRSTNASGGNSYSEKFMNALDDDISPLPSPTLASIHKYGEDDIAPMSKYQVMAQSKQKSNKVKSGYKLADFSSVTSAEDFAENSGYKSTKSDKWWSGLISQYGLSYDDLEYEYINNADLKRDEIKKASLKFSGTNETEFYEKGYDHLTANEVKIYNYLYATGGKKKAEEYLKELAETLNTRKAESEFEGIEGKTALEILRGVNVGFDQFESGVKNFGNMLVGKDDYIAPTSTQILGGMIRQDLDDDTMPVWYNFKDKQWEDEIFGATAGQFAYDSVTTASNMIPTLATAGAASVISPLAGTVVGGAMIGTSAAGNAYQSALNEGYDKDAAKVYAMGVGTLEALLQAALGGISKLGGTSKYISKAVSGIDNALLRFSLEFGGRVGSEALEEGLQEVLDPILQNAILGADEDVNWEEVAYSALLGGVMGATMGGDSNNLSHSDQKVVNKVYEAELAKKKEDGKTLTKKEKSKLYDSVVERLEKGQIDIDTIDSMYGGEGYASYRDAVKGLLEGDTYKSYKGSLEEESSLAKEIEELGAKEGATPADNFRYAELMQKRKEMQEAQAERKAFIDAEVEKITEMRTNLTNEIVKKVGENSKLVESYREFERGKQAFEADLSKYTGKQREAVERAVKSGVLNNTYRSHELVDVLSKIEADKGIVFNYTNNEKLKESGFAVEGRKINGFADKSKGTITLNVKAEKAWKSVVGHEITHVLEGTDAYRDLRNALYAYAESKGELEGRRAATAAMYNGMDADIENELTADLIGDYLFTDKAFIDKLTGNRTLFQKIYDEIKYLWNVATGKEKTEIEKVKDEFDRVWKEFKVNGTSEDVGGENSAEVSDVGTKNVQYSIREEAPPKKTIKGYKVFRVVDGKLYPPMVDNPSGNGTPVGVWLNADIGGLAHNKDGSVKLNTEGRFAVESSQGGSLSFRPGWHLGEYPDASQFGRMDTSHPLTEEELATYSGKTYKDKKSGNTYPMNLFPYNFVWAECDVAADRDYQLDAMSLGVNDKGSFVRSRAGLPYVPTDGYYKYRTNPDPNTAPWIISGAIKVNRILDDAEVAEICAQHGVTPQTREGYTNLKKKDGGSRSPGNAINLADFGLASGEVAPTDATALAEIYAAEGVAKEQSATAMSLLKTLPGYAKRKIDFADEKILNEFAMNNQDAEYYRNLAESTSDGYLVDDKLYSEESGKVQYSISEIVDENNNSYGMGVKLDSTLLENLTPDERVEMVKERVKELGGSTFTAYDNNGNAVDVTIAKAGVKFKNKKGNKVYVNKDLTGKYNKNVTKQEAVVLADELIVTAKYGESKSPAYPHGWLDNNGNNDWEYWTTYIQDKNNTIWQATLNIANAADGQKILYDISPIKKVGRSAKSDTNPTDDSIAPIPENVNTQFSLSKTVEETKDLMALHNLKASELVKTLELGGLPMPSIAVIKAQQGHEKYGDVSLIFPRDTIDPQVSSDNKVYGGDAWTPVYPRIEYKANEAVQHKVRDKYYELAEKHGYEFVKPLYKYAHELESALNSEQGEANLLDWLYNDTKLMQVYLEDSGKGKVEDIVKETRTEASESDKQMSQWFVDKLGEDFIRAFKTPKGENPLSYRKNYIEEHKAEIASAWESYCREVFQITEEQVQNVMRDTNGAMYMKFMRNAEQYLNNGGVTIKTETDYDATERAIEEKAADGYKEWVDSLFKGAEERTGIRNDKDAYTSSGNRRSWDALHWENTLENVVKAMKAQDQTGADAFSPASAIFAVAHKRYDSIDAVKADSNRLGRVSEDEYKAMEQEYASRLSQISKSIQDPNERNPFIANDQAAQLIIDAVRNYKTKAGMLRYMRKWNSRVTESTVNDIMSLVSDIANMPTGYFEAKPQRAVGLDEVGVFVIPRNADVKLKQELLNRGYSIAEYDPDVEGDRQKVVNQFEEYKFSLSKVGEESAPVGTPLKELALNKDIESVFGNIAPVGENVATAQKAPSLADIPVLPDDELETGTHEAITPSGEMVAEAPLPNEIRPMTEEEANAIQDEKAKADAAVEGLPKSRKQLHKNIINDMKATFSSGGYDLDDVLSKAKDLSTFATVDNTPQRVMEKALGYKEGQILADLTVNKVAQNETEGIKWLNSFTDRKNGLLAQISNQYRIKPGSKESAAAQMYAEGFYVNDNNDIVAYGDAELAKDFPDASVQNRIKGLAGDQRIRQIYDETLEAINKSRARNAYPEIQRLENYFLHFRAMDDTFSKLGIPFNPNDIRAKDLPTDLNGVTADLKPGQPYFASSMHRKGKRTSFDLLGGLERYLTSAKNQIYHIDDIQTLRALRNYIADTYGQAKGLEVIDLLSEEEAQDRIEKVYDAHLSTFAKFLNEEANVLAGKTALIDRGLEGIIGRRGMTFLDTVNRQVGSNMIGFNISSSLTNFIPVAQTFAKTNKFDFLKAFTQTVYNKFGSVFGNSDSFTENSPVIIRRKGADRFYRTPFQKAGDAGYVLMSSVDNISTELIARTKFNELTRKGMDEQTAHFETDKWVSRLMGDRSLGQQPQLYNSKMLGVLTKFQLEVRNQLDSQFYDTIQEAKVSNEHIENELARNAKTAAKVTATFVELAVVQHLFGKAFESVAGYNPAFDIISTIATMFGWDDDEESEDTVLDNIEQGFLALLEDLPYTSALTGGRIPISNALPVTELIKGTDSYGNEKSRWETFGEALPYYVLPGGYGQIKKTAAGLNMFSDDHPVAGSYTDSGKLRFPVEDTPLNRVQAAIFGQYASKNAREYFDNDYAPLSEKQIQEYIDVDMPIKEYREYREGLKKQETLEDKFDYISGLDLPVAKKNILINNVVDRKEAVDLEGYEDFGSLEEFDFATKNPEKYAFAKSVGGYSAYQTYSDALYDIKADKDENGKSINGSRKEKVLNYINNLDADFYTKIILYKSEYPSDDTYNRDIVNYINERSDLSYEDRVAILTELGFRVTADGQIYAD